MLQGTFGPTKGQLLPHAIDGLRKDMVPVFLGHQAEDGPLPKGPSTEVKTNTLREKLNKSRATPWCCFVFALWSCLSLLPALPFLPCFSSVGKPTQLIEWRPNVKVLAAAGQNQVTSNAPNYAKSLIETLKKPNIKGLDDAEALLEKNFYRGALGLKQQPVSTPRNLAGWEKGNHKPPRFILLLAQEDFRSHNDFLEKELKSLYGLSSTHIYRMDKIQPGDLFKGIQLLNKSLEKSKEKNPEIQPEFLIVYSGHGDTTSSGIEGGNEGFAKGRLDVGTEEQDLKWMIHRYLPMGKVYILLNSCRSGAFIG